MKSKKGKLVEKKGKFMQLENKVENFFFSPLSCWISGL